MQTVNGDYRMSDHNRDHYQPPMQKSAAPIPSRKRQAGSFVLAMIIAACGLGGISAAVIAIGELLHR